ncbi:MAG: hypothetical protein ABJF23_16720 [Bryobacteraceae bacterium]
MKVTSVETICLRQPDVKFHCDSVATFVVGEDPFETAKIWHNMYRGNIYSGRRGADRGLLLANRGFTTYINVMVALRREPNLRESLTRQKLRAKDG